MTAQDGAPLCYRLLDAVAMISAPDPEARAALSAIFRGFPRAPADARAAHYAMTRSDRGGWCVDALGTRVFDEVSFADALIGVESEIVARVVSSDSPCLHLHGAALRAPSGGASLVLLGASGTGKTTLGLALMARGLLPFADDVVFIEPETLSPRTFARAFHVDESSRALIAGLTPPPRWSFDDVPAGYFVPPEWASGVAPVRAIFFPVRCDRPRPAVLPLSVAQTTVALLSLTLTLDRDPRLALAVAAHLTTRASGYVLQSADLESTADAVMSVMNDR